MPRPGLRAQDFGDPLGTHGRPVRTYPPVAGTVPVRAQIYLLAGPEGAPQLLFSSAERGLPP
jgi:hypothetical protein